MSNNKAMDAPLSPVIVFAENLAPLDASHDDMVQRSRCV